MLKMDMQIRIRSVDHELDEFPETGPPRLL